MHRLTPIAFRLGRCIALVLYCALGLVFANEAVGEKRSYNLPRGDASTTLNQFAAASERHVIFMVAKVQGVQTNAIVGEFSPTDALTTMLEKTGLYAITDPVTGDFVVTRKQSGSDRSLGKGDPKPSTNNPENNMKRPNVFHRLGAALSLLVAQQAVLAQSADKGSNGSGTPEPTITLSPFEVSTTAETGYVATDSLVGSRVNTKLKDIASTIDVLTPDFLQDIGASSIADAVIYSSNFGAPFDQNIGPNDGVASISLEARPRGLDNATISTDFFATNLPIDFYNIERVNLAYGAQGVLFGLGNAGGVLDSSTKRAQMRDMTTLEFKFDSWGSARESLDFNKQLIQQKLAVRLIGLKSDDHQFTEGGTTKSLRGFGTLTYKPFNKTTIRTSYEQIDVTAQRATNYVSYDLLSPWVAAGRALFNDSTGNGTIAATNSIIGKNTNALRVFSYGGTGTSLLPWNGTALTLGPNQAPGGFNQGNQSLMNSSIYSVDRDPRVLARENRIKGQQFRASVEQRITDDLHFELGFSHERRNELSGGAFDNAESVNILADPNQYLPGGSAANPVLTPNPNAGKLYIETFPHVTTTFNSTNELRLTGYYEFDSEKHLTGILRWLGRHRLTSLVSTREDVTKSQEDRAVAVGDTSFTTGNKLDNSRFLRVRYYLDPASGNFEATPLPGAGMFGPYQLTDSRSGSPVTYALNNNPEGSAFAPSGTKIDVNSVVAGLQSYFFGDRVITFVGLRSDHVKTYYFDPNSTLRHDQTKAGDQLGLYPHMNEAHFTSAPTAVQTTALPTFGVVAHPLPWASLFYNQSKNTSLPPGVYGPFGEALQGTSSNGYDYGVGGNFLNERFSIKLDFFQDNQVGLWNNPFTQLRDYSALIEQTLRGPSAVPGLGPVPASTFDPVANPTTLYRSNTDKTTYGMDIIAVANLTPNWTLRTTVGRQRDLVLERGQEWINWIGTRLPVWQNAGGLGWDNVVIPSDGRTIHNYYLQQVVPQEAAQQIATGIVRFHEREWRANVLTDYHFTEGRLKGFNVGGGVRWWGKANTGTGGVVIPGIVNPVNTPKISYYNEVPQTFVDILLGYRRRFKVAGSSYSLNLHVNIRNVFNEYHFDVSRTTQEGFNYEYLRSSPRQTVFTADIGF